MSELERKLLSCLTDPDALSRVWDLGLKPEVFEEPLCRAAYAFATAYWLENQMAPTTYVIEHELPGFKFETEVEESVTWLAETLQRRFATNQVQEMLRTAASTCHTDPIDTLRTLYADAYESAEAVAPRLTRSDMTNIEERRRRYITRGEKPGGIGLTLGLPELDAHTGGLMPGELAAIGAYSKVGKTMFLVMVAAALRRAGHTPIFFTLEMSIAEIEDRIDSMFSGVSYDRFTHSKLTFDEVKRWHAAQDELAGLGGILVERPEEGDRTVANLITRARQAGADFVVIDQLSHMEPGKKTRDLKEHHGTIMKQLSTEISRPGKEIPCLLAVQLNRDSQSTSETMGLKHFANASEIEREVDLALGLSRTGEERRNNMMQAHILGARRSDIKSWTLHWQLKECTRIAVLDEIA